MNGITTISPRGRYFTVLCWALCEFFESEKGVSGRFDRARLGCFLSRVEFLVLACTALDPGPGDSGGALGRLSYEPELRELSAGKAVEPRESARSAMMAAYFGPCRALGLIRGAEPGDPVGFAMTPRGQQIWKARSSALADANWAGAVRGGSLDAEEARSLAPHFSLKRLADFPDESGALRLALERPWPAPGQAGEDVTKAYDRFRQTVAWLRQQAEGAPAKPLEADKVLHGAWSQAALAGRGSGGIADAWAEYEWRRRLHFAVELALSAVSDTVSDLDGPTLGEAVGHWLDGPANVGSPAATRLAAVWPDHRRAAGLTCAEAVQSVPAGLYLDHAPPGDLANLPAGNRAFAAFALASALARQSAPLRAQGTFRYRDGHAGERALACLEAPPGMTFRDGLEAFAGIAVGSHLTNTFRKMAAGQHCSLRFFPEGPRLLGLGRPTGAGRSGSRLWNVINVLRDAGEPGIAGP